MWLGIFPLKTRQNTALSTRKNNQSYWLVNRLIKYIYYTSHHTLGHLTSPHTISQYITHFILSHYTHHITSQNSTATHVTCPNFNLHQYFTSKVVRLWTRLLHWNKRTSHAVVITTDRAIWSASACVDQDGLARLVKNVRPHIPIRPFTLNAYSISHKFL